VANPQWMILGDFNLIYRARDKNSGTLDRKLMLRFSKAIHHMEVREADLIGKRYTWSNNQNPQTLTRIDSVLPFVVASFHHTLNQAKVQV
jgi:hypothetical protein